MGITDDLSADRTFLKEWGATKGQDTSKYFTKKWVHKGFCSVLQEEIRKQAWITIVEGPLTGKEFILFKQATSIGSASHCDIPLFKDSDVAPEHARIEQSGNIFVIVSLAGPAAVLVNGAPATNMPLRSGDLLQIGSTAFYYQDRAMHEA